MDNNWAMSEEQMKEMIFGELVQGATVGDTRCSFCHKVVLETEAFITDFDGEHDANGDPVATVTCEDCQVKSLAVTLTQEVTTFTVTLSQEVYKPVVTLSHEVGPYSVEDVSGIPF